MIICIQFEVNQKSVLFFEKQYLFIFILYGHTCMLNYMYVLQWRPSWISVQQNMLLMTI